MSDDNNLTRLGERLDAMRASENKEKQAEIDDQENNENMNRGLKAGMELVTSIAAGAFIGWLLDSWLGTAPWFLIVFLLAGMGAGFMAVYKITQNIGNSVGFAPLHKKEKRAKNAPER